MNIKEISISVEQEQSVSLNVNQEKNVDIGFEKREVVSEERVERAYHDYNFTFNQENGKLELTMISNDGKEKTIEVDLPTEELVKNVEYSEENQEIIIEWENGQKTNIPLENLMNGYVDLNSSQNIAGAKSFSRSITRGPKQDGQTGYVDIGSNSTPFDRGYITYLNAPISMVTFKPQYDDSKDLGASNSRWRNLYLSGNLTDGTNEITVAQIVNMMSTLTREQLVSTIGEATASLSGLMSAEDKTNLNTLVALLQEDDNDVVDKINEVLSIFNQYPEGANLVSALLLKANKDEVVDLTSDQTISGVKTFSTIKVKYPDKTNFFQISPDSNGYNVKFSFGNSVLMMLHNGGITNYRDILPDTNGTRNLGSSSASFKNAYISGYLSDGTNNVSVSDIANKSEVPTNTSQLTNNSGFITNTVNNLTNYYLKSETYTKSEVQQLLSTISSLKLEVVTNLPTTNISTTTIYLKPLSTTDSNNTYEEYVYINNKWEIIGTTKVDLSGYVEKEELSKLATKEELQDTSNAHINSMKKQFALGYSQENISATSNNDWQLKTSSLGNVVRAVTYGNGYWVAVGAGGITAYSNDTTNWTSLTPFATTGTLTGVTYGNGRFIIVEHCTTYGKIWSADKDPINWTNIYQTAEGFPIEGIRFINDRFFAVGAKGYLAYSLDGEKWTEVNSSTENDIIDIAYGDGKYVACCYNGIIVYSYNGNNWYTSSDENFTNNYRHICYGNNMFVAGGQNGVMRYSFDGITWKSGTSNGGQNGWVRGFAYSNKRFFAVKYGTPLGEVLFSQDGINWESCFSITNQRFWCLTEYNGIFLLGGSGGIIYTLDLGIEWLDSQPQGNHIYYRFVLNKNNGNQIIGESYYEVRQELHYYNTTAPQTEWFRIAKVKDIEKASSGIFTFNIYSVNSLTGNKEVLSADVFSSSCGFREGEFISDTLSIAHAQTNDVTGSGFSGNTNVGQGLTAIRFEKYLDEIYMCALFSIPLVEHKQNLEIEMIIENNINFEYLKEFQLIFFENEYLSEYPMLEGVKLEEEKNYAIKLRTSANDLINALKEKTPLLIQAIDTTGDMGHLDFIEITVDEQYNDLYYITCSPKVPVDEEKEERIKKKFNPEYLIYLWNYGTEKNMEDSVLKELNNYGDLIRVITYSLGDDYPASSILKKESNEYLTTRMKNVDIYFWLEGNNLDENAIATFKKNGEVIGEITPTSDPLLVSVTNEKDVYNIETSNIDASYLKFRVDLDSSMAEIEIPFHQKIPLYVDLLSMTGNDVYNFSISYQEYFPHITSQSFAIASLYRNVTSVNNNQWNYLYSLQEKVDSKVNQNKLSFGGETASVEDKIQYLIWYIWQQYIYGTYYLNFSYILNCDFSGQVLYDFYVSVSRATNGGDINSSIKLLDLNSLTRYEYSLNHSNKYWEPNLQEITYEKIEVSSGGSTTPQIMITNPTQSYENVDYNKYYVFEEITHSQFTLSIGTQKEGVVNELMGEIRLDENPLEVQFTQPIRWNENDKVEKNGNYLKLSEKHTHIYSVINGLGLITSFENPTLDTPTLTLTDSTLSWTAVEHAESYDVFANDILLVNTTKTSVDLSAYLTDPAIYTIKIVAKSNSYTDSNATTTFTISVQLATPTNLVLSDTNQLSWDSVENASSYIVTLVETGATSSVTTNLCNLPTAFTALGTAGTYTFYVYAIGDGVVYLTSKNSETIALTI